MKKIAIIGHGHVGRGMEKLFKDRFEIVIHERGQSNRQAVNACDLAIVCVPTDALPDGRADTSIVEEVVSWLQTPLILIKSTVPPGTTDRLADRWNRAVCFSPEYMGESKYFTPFWKYPDPENAKSHTFVIIGGRGGGPSQIAAFFMKVMSVDTQYSLTSAVEAELTKYMENCFFATKVLFCNEFYGIAKAFGVDYKSLREHWLLDPRINRNHTLVFDDERGFGGKCLPKDLSAMIHAAIAAGYDPVLLREVLRRNEEIREIQSIQQECGTA